MGLNNIIGITIDSNTLIYFFENHQEYAQDIEDLFLRVESGEINAFEKESLSYHEKVNKSYIRLAQKNNWPIVDANKPLESVLNKAYSLVYNVVKEKK